jgi:ketosteroid isomerase-like protein
MGPGAASIRPPECGEEVRRVGETEDFLAAVLPRQVAAGTAVHNGDAAPWVDLWSQSDPVTLFGARSLAVARPTSKRSTSSLGDWFRDCSSYEINLVAAGVSGDLGYTVAYERTTASVRGGPAKPYTLRVTHVFRREKGEWRVVHRHGDAVPEGDRRWPRRSCTRRSTQPLEVDAPPKRNSTTSPSCIT